MEIDASYHYLPLKGLIVEMLIKLVQLFHLIANGRRCKEVRGNMANLHTSQNYENVNNLLISLLCIFGPCLIFLLPRLAKDLVQAAFFL